MEQKIKDLISKLKAENNVRTDKLSKGGMSDYNHTVTVHLYNHTLGIIKELESILK